MSFYIFSLTPYIYKPIVVNLNDEELDEYRELSAKIARLFATKNNDVKESLNGLLFKRQNIINNAEEKYEAFRNILRELNRLNIKKVSGVFADLGVSSKQFDNKQRGFSLLLFYYSY